MSSTLAGWGNQVAPGIQGAGPWVLIRSTGRACHLTLPALSSAKNGGALSTPFSLQALLPSSAAGELRQQMAQM